MQALKTFALLIAMGIVLFICSNNINSRRDRAKFIVKSDGKGYYAYLPAFLIYYDLNFGFYDSIDNGAYFNPNLVADYRVSHNGKYVNKYPVGVALALLPFYLPAHIIALATEHPDDGYSKPYQYSVMLAGIMYVLLGCFFIGKILQRFKISGGYSALVQVAIVLGTNIFYYAVIEPSMSHVYSFGLISVFVYASFRYFETFNRKYFLLLAFLLGLITLIRPTNGIIALILPFAAGSFTQLRKGIFALSGQKLFTALSILLLFALLMVQPVIYKIQSGSFFVYTYGSEGLDFLHPHIIKVLFSYKKGLFVYTPMLLLSLTGFYFLWRQNKFRFIYLLCFLLVVLYMIASWNIWWYGGSFSLRPFMDYYCLFAILLALPLQALRKPLRSVYIGLIILLIVFCQIQTYQYRYFQIHWENMDKQKYWDVFLRIDKLVKKTTNPAVSELQTLNSKPSNFPQLPPLISVTAKSL